MTHALHVTDVHLTHASGRARASGIDGYVSCTVNGLRVNCLTARRTRAGRRTISILRRHGYPVVCGLSPTATRALEAQILAALALENAS